MLHAYRSNQFDDLKRVNESLKVYCPENTTFEEVKQSTSNFLNWSVNNKEKVRSDFFQKSKIISKLEYFNIPFEFDEKSFKDGPEENFVEFQDKWDKSAELEICFCHWQLSKKKESTSEIAEYCSHGTWYNSKIFVIVIISGTIITFVNFVILKIVPKLFYMIPFDNLTKRENYIVLVTLVFLYINSVLAPLLIHSSEFLKIFRKNNFASIEHSKLPYIMTFYDFEHEWYDEVGIKIAISLLFNLLYCTVIEFTRVKINAR